MGGFFYDQGGDLAWRVERLALVGLRRKENGVWGKGYCLLRFVVSFCLISRGDRCIKLSFGMPV